jgi:hypothetical protein
MKASVLTSALLLTLAGMVSPPALRADTADPLIARQVIGTWNGYAKGFERSVECRANGVFIVRLRPTDLPFSLYADAYEYQGTWKVVDGKFYSTVLLSNFPGVKPGTTYQHPILRLTSDIFRTTREEGGAIEFNRCYLCDHDFAGWTMSSPGPMAQTQRAGADALAATTAAGPSAR